MGCPAVFLIRLAASDGHDGVYRRALGPPPPAPAVSVLLATRRARLRRRAIASVAKQDYAALELVLALHGERFLRGRVADRLRDFPHPATVVTAGSADVLGAVLNRASSTAGGLLLAKMDDDNVYAPEHVRDLVAAQRAAGAELVGKANEVVYLTSRDRTVVLLRGGGRLHLNVSGSALLVHRDDLRRAGGWRRRRSGVDVALALDVVRRGVVVYRTQGFGYVYLRHGGVRTSAVPDRRFEARAQAVHCGWRPDLAGMPGAPAP